jgi:hypothetical protein
LGIAGSIRRGKCAGNRFHRKPRPELFVLGSKMLFWNPSESVFDMLRTTGPVYLSAGYE